MANYVYHNVKITEADPGDVEKIKETVKKSLCVNESATKEDDGNQLFFDTQDKYACDQREKIFDAGKHSTVEYTMDAERGLYWYKKTRKGETIGEEILDPSLFWAGYLESNMDSWAKMFICPKCGKKHRLLIKGTPHEGWEPAYGKTYKCNCGHVFDLEGYKNKVIKDRDFDNNVGLFDQPEYFMEGAGNKILDALRTIDDPESLNKINAIGKDLLRIGHKIKLDRATDRFLETGKLPSMDLEKRDFINEIIDLAAVTKERRTESQKEIKMTEKDLNKPTKPKTPKEKMIQQAGPDVAEFVKTGKMPKDADPETMKKIIEKALELKQRIKEKANTQNEEIPF